MGKGSRPVPVGLTIAGSDSGGGAGIQADIKAMQANGVFAASVVTAVTAQNTRAVTHAMDLPIDIIEAQIDAVCDDIDVDAVKTGMLSSSEIIEAVVGRIRKWELAPLVVDPVMISKSGYPLLQEGAIETLRNVLLPLATIVTPNVHEAELLADLKIETVEDAEKAARRIMSMGPSAVLVKGGHLAGEKEAVDVLFDGEEMRQYRAPYIDTHHTHGTGCTYSAAIAANLAKGMPLAAAVGEAKDYISAAIRYGLAIGSGHGPTDHFFFMRHGM